MQVLLTVTALYSSSVKDFLFVSQSYEDSSEYDSVADEMNLLHLREMQPAPSKSLLQHMFCLPLN